MELDYITVSRLLLVPLAKGLWKHYKLVSVNLFQIILAVVQWRNQTKNLGSQSVWF